MWTNRHTRIIKPIICAISCSYLIPFSSKSVSTLCSLQFIQSSGLSPYNIFIQIYLAELWFYRDIETYRYINRKIKFKIVNLMLVDNKTI